MIVGISLAGAGREKRYSMNWRGLPVARRLPAVRAAWAPQHNAAGEQFKLTFEMGAARLDFIGFGVAVFRRAALDDIADKDIIPRQPHCGNHIGQQPPARPTNASPQRPRRSRPFADEDQLGLRMSLSGYGVGAGCAQAAFLALADDGGDFVEGGIRFGCGGSWFHRLFVRNRHGRLGNRMWAANAEIARIKSIQFQVPCQNGFCSLTHHRADCTVTCGQTQP